MWSLFLLVLWDLFGGGGVGEKGKTVSRRLVSSRLGFISSAFFPSVGMETAVCRVVSLVLP